MGLLCVVVLALATGLYSKSQQAAFTCPFLRLPPGCSSAQAHTPFMSHTSHRPPSPPPPGPMIEADGQFFNRRWGYLSRAGVNDKSQLMRQIEKYADIYTSRVSNFLRYTPFEVGLLGGGWLAAQPGPQLGPQPALRAGPLAGSQPGSQPGTSRTPGCLPPTPCPLCSISAPLPSCWCMTGPRQMAWCWPAAP